MTRKGFKQADDVLAGFALKQLVVVLFAALISVAWTYPASAQIFLRENREQPPPPATEEQKAAYRRRLTAVADASLDWMMDAANCDDRQREEAARIWREHLEKELEHRLPKDIVLTPNDTLPGFFGSKGSATWRFLNGVSGVVFRTVLTPEQQKIAGANETGPYRRRQLAYRDYCFATADAELYFTRQQRDESMWAWGVGSAYDRVFFGWYEGAFPQRKEISLGPKTPFTWQQQLVLMFLRERQQLSYVKFPAELAKDDEAGFDRILRQDQDRIGQFYFAMAKVRIDWYIAEHQISEERQQQLLTAAKGEVVEILDHRRAGHLATFQSHRDNFPDKACSSSAPLPTTQEFVAGSHWAPVVRDIFPAWNSDPEHERKARIRGITAKAVVAMLSEELWLLPQQWAPLIHLVEPSLPNNLEQLVGPGEVYEIVNLARALSGVDAEQLAELLNEPQQRAWKEMSDAMGFHEEDGKLYARIFNPIDPFLERTLIVQNQ